MGLKDSSNSAGSGGGDIALTAGICLEPKFVIDEIGDNGR
jgi:hypothetical protein